MALALLKSSSATIPWRLFKMKSRAKVTALVASTLLGAVGCAGNDGSDSPPRRDESVASTRQAMTVANSSSYQVSGVIPPPAMMGPGISFNASTSTVSINGTGQNDVASVVYYGRGSIKVTMNDVSATYTTSSVTAVAFYGYDGDDSFTNATSIESTANGGDGNDALSGGSGADFLVGGYGQDTIYGNAGDDTLWGSGGSDKVYGDDGNDVIYGHGGNDELHGGNSRDTFYGGSGDDQIFGDDGQDLIVTVGLGVDTVSGGNQWDNYWMDASDVLTDASANELSLGYVHKIGQFQSVSYNGGNTSTPVGLDPAGEDLPDPLPGTSASLANFADNSLFASVGPSKDDVLQGSVGDCYFMSPLAALADATDEYEYIRKMVVHLGDGTYGVRFYRSGQEKYVRVDADLWVSGSTPILAKPGLESSIWVPIVEKAYAFFRRNEGNYDSIASGDGATAEHLNAVDTHWTIQDGIAAADVVAWYNNNSPNGTMKNAVNAGAVSLMNWYKSQRALGKAVIAGSRSGVSNNTPIMLDDPNTAANESTYHRGQHIYMVDHVQTDANGNPTGVVLRDPYGIYRTITDFTRIYFCLGGGAVFDV